MNRRHTIELKVNGEVHRLEVEDRMTLADGLRDGCGLTGTHLGCEHGVCGACTVIVDGSAVRACLMFARQAEGCDVTTIEGIAPTSSTLHPVQAAFQENHGLQCGFCTPGFVMSACAFTDANPGCSEDELVDALSGNLCRCTGYQGIAAAVRSIVQGPAQ